MQWLMGSCQQRCKACAATCLLVQSTACSTPAAQHTRFCSTCLCSPPQCTQLPAGAHSQCGLPTCCCACASSRSISMRACTSPSSLAAAPTASLWFTNESRRLESAAGRRAGRRRAGMRWEACQRPFTLRRHLGRKCYTAARQPCTACTGSSSSSSSSTAAAEGVHSQQGQA